MGSWTEVQKSEATFYQQGRMNNYTKKHVFFVLSPLLPGPIVVVLATMAVVMPLLGIFANPALIICTEGGHIALVDYMSGTHRPYIPSLLHYPQTAFTASLELVNSSLRSHIPGYCTPLKLFRRGI